MGVADPTGGLPEDSIFLPGLQEQLTACEGPESSWIVVKALHTYNNPQFKPILPLGSIIDVQQNHTPRKMIIVAFTIDEFKVKASLRASLHHSGKQENTSGPNQH